MRSRRSAISARRTALLARRSSRLSLGPANDFRRARASAEVIGAGATGPLRRAAALRLGVGRPLGAVLCEPRDDCDSDESVDSPSAGVCAPSWSPAALAVFSSFLRPSSFTLARLLRSGGSGQGLPGRWSGWVHVPAVGPTLAEMTGSAADVGDVAPATDRVPAILRVLVAPDCYGDSLTAVEAAAAIATGWNRARPDDQFIIAPQSDGGPGFVDVLASRLGERRHLEVSGPLDEDVQAEWVLEPESATAYLECAQACGLARLGGPPTPRTALSAHSRGVGQLIAAALQAGAARDVGGVGGGASND